MKKIRLVVVGPVPPPIGGVETVTKAVIESQAFFDFDRKHFNITKNRAKQFQGRFDIPNSIIAARHIKKFSHLIKEFSPDAVYQPVSGAWSGFLRDSMLARIAKKSGAKVFGHVHGAWFHYLLKTQGFKRNVVQRGLSNFDHLLVLGSLWKNLLKEFQFGGEVHIVPSTMRQEAIDYAKTFQRDYKPKNEYNAIFVGQVGKRKGVYDLLQVMKELLNEKIPINLMFVGPAEQEGEMERAIVLQKELKLEKVTCFVGTKMDTELYDLYKSSDFLVLPSYDENLPVVILEAGVFGLPVIVSPVGAIPELIHKDENGFLVQPGNLNEIKQAMIAMVSSVDLQRKFGTQLRIDVQNYYPDNVCKKIADIIRKAVNEN